MTEQERDTDELAKKLHGTTDAQVWAEEFVKQYPMALSAVEGQEGVVADKDEWTYAVLTWFANAIETGRDAGYRSCVATHG